RAVRRHRIARYAPTPTRRSTAREANRLVIARGAHLLRPQCGFRQSFLPLEPGLLRRYRKRAQRAPGWLRSTSWYGAVVPVPRWRVHARAAGVRHLVRRRGAAPIPAARPTRIALPAGRAGRGGRAA